ncbi:putative mitochondrial import inner membrane translocase subunit TIM22 [Dioscorea sansibarensis]
MTETHRQAPPVGDAPRIQSSDGWKERIVIPTLLGGVVGGGFGLVSKHRKTHAASLAANLAIVAGCYCGARELARDARESEPDDLMNSVIGGISSGALLGRLQGGQLGAIRYAIVFATVGTTLDYATIRLKPHFNKFLDTIRQNVNSDWTLPEWSPIQVLDEEALAAKRAREEQLYSQKVIGKLNKEKS